MEYTEQLNKYRDHLTKISGYSHQTVITYLFYVKKLLNNNCDYKLLMSGLSEQTNNTKRIILSAVKNYYKYSNNVLANEIILPKKDKKLKGHISIEQYRELREKYSSSKYKTLIIRMLFETGIRSSEFLSIKVSDIDNQKIMINGKGNKQRIIYTSLSLHEFIMDFIKYKGLTNDDYVINFDYRNLYKHVRAIGNSIGAHLTPHMFRRGFATYCLDQNIGIYEISLMMGHDNINTTRMYLRNERRIEIMKNLFE